MLLFAALSILALTATGLLSNYVLGLGEPRRDPSTLSVLACLVLNIGCLWSLLLLWRAFVK
jgi:hypothetical protein